MANWWDDAQTISPPPKQWWEDAYAHNPNPTASDLATDVGASIGSGLARGAVEGVMAPLTLNSLAQQGMSGAARFVVDTGRQLVGLPPRTAEERAAIEAAQTSGIQNTVNAAQEAVRGGMDSVLYAPRTDAGQVAQAVSEFVPAGAVGPGGVASRLLRYGVAPGVGSTVAGHYAEGTPYEPAARIAGGIAGGGVGHMARSPASHADNVMGRAAQGVTEIQFAEAQRLIRDAAARGITLTPAEAIQQVSGGGSRLGEIQRLVESSAEGGARMAPVMARRPGEIEAAGRGVIDQIGPRSQTPSAQGQQLQSAADDVLTQARQQNNAVAQPYYDALRGERIPAVPATGMGPSADYARLAANPSYQMALRDLRNDPELAPLIGNLPDDSIAVVNEVVKRLDTGVQTARGTAMVPGDNQLAMMRQQAREAADQTATQVSPNYRTARDIVRTGNEQIIEPLRAGPVGQIASTPDVTSQVGAIMPRNPLPGSERETRQALQELMTASPEAARGVVRQGIEMPFNAATANGPGNIPAQYGGARFARDMQGNPQRYANVQEAIDTAAGPLVREDFDRLMDVYSATGYRQHPGSKTAFNQQEMEAIKTSGIPGLVRTAVNPFAGVREKIANARLSSQMERLVEALLAGESSIPRIAEMARRAGGSPARDALVRAVLTTGVATDPRLAIAATP